VAEKAGVNGSVRFIGGSVWHDVLRVQCGYGTGSIYAEAACSEGYFTNAAEYVRWGYRLPEGARVCAKCRKRREADPWLTRGRL